MTIAVSLDHLAQRLDAYQEQLAALSQALGGLREMSDNLIIALQADRAAVDQHMQSPETSAPAPAVAEQGIEPELSAVPASEATAEDLTLDEVAIEAESEVIKQAASAVISIDETLSPEAETEAAKIVASGAEESPADPIEENDARHIVEMIADAAQLAATDLLAETAVGDVRELAAETATEASTYLELPTAIADQKADADITATEETPASIPKEAAPAQEQPQAEAISAEPAAGPVLSTENATSADTVEAPASAEAPASNVVDLAAKRRKGLLATTARRRFAAIAAMLVVTAGATFGFNELMHSELGQRLIELGACDADMVSANRDCAFLSWLTL